MVQGVLLLDPGHGAADYNVPQALELISAVFTGHR